MNFLIAAERLRCYRNFNGPAVSKHGGRADNDSNGASSVIYGEPETVRFLAALQRMKLQRKRRSQATKQAKQKVRAVLRKMRAC